jgi:hypothetical protein
MILPSYVPHCNIYSTSLNCFTTVSRLAFVVGRIPTAGCQLREKVARVKILQAQVRRALRIPSSYWMTKLLLCLCPFRRMCQPAVQVVLKTQISTWYLSPTTPPARPSLNQCPHISAETSLLRSRYRAPRRFCTAAKQSCQYRATDTSFLH